MEITQKGYKCDRCGYEWTPRKKEKPIVCPKCKSPYWNIPKNDKK
jgi:predicted Zn-ribbon and HTH transcriptional regulator